MLVSIEGDAKTGKTTFLYTAPLPIVSFSFDMGIERAIHGVKFEEWFKDCKMQVIPYIVGAEPVPAWADYDITIYELPPPIQLQGIRVVGFAALWDYFIQLVVAAITDPTVRTIGIDTMTLARRVRADAFLESLQVKAERENKDIRERLTQFEWAVPDGDIRNLYATCEGYKKNLVTIHHLTDERTDGIDKDGRIVQGMLTGKRILEGLKNTDRLVDTGLRFSIKDKQPLATFVTCGNNLSLEGVSLASPMWDTVMQVIEDTLGGTIEFERRNHH